MSDPTNMELHRESALEIEDFLSRYTLHDGGITEVLGGPESDKGFPIYSLSISKYIWWNDFNQKGNLLIEFEDAHISTQIKPGMIIHTVSATRGDRNVLILIDNEIGLDIVIEHKRAMVIPDSVYKVFIDLYPTT